MFLTFQRSRQLGRHTKEEIQLFSDLIPHLRRSAVIGHQFERRSSEGSWNRPVLEQLGFAAVLVNRHGIISDLNAEPQRLVRTGGPIRLQFDRIGLTSQERTRNLHTAIQRVIDSRMGTNFSIRGSTPDHCHLNAVLIPTQSAAYWLTNPEAVLLVKSSSSAPTSTIDVLRTSFKLTIAEARLLQALAAGETINDYCGRMCLSRNTIKTQLRSLFNKTSTSRQVDLVRLVSNHSIPLAPVLTV